MKKMVIASTLIALLATNSCLAAKDNSLAIHPKYPQLSFVSLELPSITSNQDRVAFLSWLNKNSVPFNIMKIVEANSTTTIEGIIQDQKIKFSIESKHAKNAKIKVLDKIYIRNTKEGFIFICNDVPIAVVSKYEDKDKFKSK